MNPQDAIKMNSLREKANQHVVPEYQGEEPPKPTKSSVKHYNIPSSSEPVFRSATSTSESLSILVNNNKLIGQCDSDEPQNATHEVSVDRSAAEEQVRPCDSDDKRQLLEINDERAELAQHASVEDSHLRQNCYPERAQYVPQYHAQYAPQQATQLPVQYVVQHPAQQTPQYAPQYPAQHAPQYPVQYPAQYPVQQAPQYAAQYPVQYAPQYPAQYPAQYAPQYAAQYPAQYPVQQAPQYPAQYPVQQAPQYAPQYPAQYPAQYAPQYPTQYAPQYSS